jgi:hypothetical protein
MEPKFELLFKASAQLERPVQVGDTPQGARRVVPIVGGRFAGPSMSGEVLAGGADWQFTRPDGVTELDAVYLLRTDDGVVIQVRNRGLRHGSEDVMRRLAAGEPVEPSEYYFRGVPTFSAPRGRYDWLNRNVFVCTGTRQPASVDLWVYRVG